jgi:divalent metal cation (Fe/Co/Zn/Cd) transporter
VLLMSTAVPAVPSGVSRTMLAHRIRLLVAFTITYNVIEAAVAITAGTLASSTALVGFGLDSVIEVSSAAAVAWQFSVRDHERREGAALRVTAVSFFALAAYVGMESVRALVSGHHADHSTVGLVLAATSLVVMPALSTAQRRAGRQLDSASAVADSKQTLLCTYLSAVLLVGLGLNSLYGFWWADPAAGLVIAVIAVKEGISAWHGRSCCPSPVGMSVEPATGGCCGSSAQVVASEDGDASSTIGSSSCCTSPPQSPGAKL